MGAKVLQPGEVFVTRTMLLDYKRKRPYPVGKRLFCNKKNKRYFCEVLKLVETTTGYHRTPFSFGDPVSLGPRYWRFLYLVKVLD